MTDPASAAMPNAARIAPSASVLLGAAHHAAVATPAAVSPATIFVPTPLCGAIQPPAERIASAAAVPQSQGASTVRNAAPVHAIAIGTMEAQATVAISVSRGSNS